MLTQNKINLKFREFNLRLDSILKTYDENSDKTVKINEERIKRIVNIEADVY